MYQFRLWQYQLQTWPKLIIDFTQLHKVNYCEKSTSGSSTSRKARKPELDVWLLGVDRKDNVQLHLHPHQFTRASKSIQYIWNNITVERPLHGEFNNLFWSLPESHAMTKRVSCLALDWNCPPQQQLENFWRVFDVHLATLMEYHFWKLSQHPSTDRNWPWP